MAPASGLPIFGAQAPGITFLAALATSLPILAAPAPGLPILAAPVQAPAPAQATATLRRCGGLVVRVPASRSPFPDHTVILYK